MNKEDFSYNGKRVKDGNSGEMKSRIFIDPEQGEKPDSYTMSDLKKYKATPDPNNSIAHKQMGWTLPNDEKKRQAMLSKNVYPAIEHLTSIENGDKPTRSFNDVKKIIDELIAEIDKAIDTPVVSPQNVGIIDDTAEINAVSDKDFKTQLKNFKEELLSITSAEEFLKRFAPMLKPVAGENGYNYSFINSLLIRLQDPNATMVLSRTRWNHLNHYVIEKGAKAIYLFVPIPVNGTKREIEQNFLKEKGKKSLDELTPEEREELRQRIEQSLKGSVYFGLFPNFFDIRFTKVMHGRKDLVQGGGEKLVNTKNGNENGDLEWFDANSPVTPESEKLYDSVIALIQNSGIDLSYVKDLGGARGVSKGGRIEVLEGAPKNAGTINTLIHEFSHELFHHDFFKKKEAKPWGNFYKGGVYQLNRGVIEQQAELCAWVVMRFLGYDMPTNINYVGNWGLNSDSACERFDEVANAANSIINGIKKFQEVNIEDLDNTQLKTLNEDTEQTQGPVTGEMIASMLGDKYEEAYEVSKEKQENEISLQQNALRESFKKICGIII